MNQKLLSKVLATMLAVILTFANFVMLGVYATKSYATEDSLENQKTVSNNENVSFDAYFMEESGKKLHSTKHDIDETAKIYLAVNVEKGYLKNAKIEMLGENGSKANFKIVSSDEQFESVENIDANANAIFLKQVNAGTGIVLEVPISSIKEDVFDLSNFNKINNITLTGSYVGNSGKTTEIEKTIKTRNEWTKEIKVSLEQETKTFIPYEVKESKGTILQTVIKTGLENNALPVKETKMTVKVPQINEIKPEKVIVSANTYATNNNKEFTNNNWEYDAEAGVVSIKVENIPNENKVEWNKLAKDEYMITYIYNEKIEAADVKQDVELKVTAYNVTKEITQESSLQIKESEVKGNFVTTQILSNNELSKGYLYTNSEKEVEYCQDIKLDIAYSELVNKLLVESNTDNFINSNGEAVSAEGVTYYKSTSISKENFEKILGTEGYVKIIGVNGEQLAIFTKETATDENGNYKYEYANEQAKIKIETSKPITEGSLQINNVKGLKGKTSYKKSEVLDFQKLQLKQVTNVEYADTLLETKDTTKDITLIAPSTKVEANMNISNLSTVVKNENVEFKVILRTNDISCDLYKNPVIEMVLPNYISELKIKDIDLLFDDELTIKSKTAYKNENGNIVIKVELKGEQTKYSQNELSKGANLVINTDITVRKLTPTKNDIVKVYVANENATIYQPAVRTYRLADTRTYTEIPMEVVAPTGIVTINEISNYNKDGEIVTSISGEEKVGKLETRTDVKNAKVKMSIINNYQNEIKNISILGRIPFEGNKTVVTKEDLGSNLNTTLNNAISSNGIDANKVKVYYSANGDATKDLQDTNNGWTLDVANLSSAKSYLIVLNDYQMNTGDTIEFNYGVQIPENLQHDLSTYATYTVYFDNVNGEETVSENVTATKVGLSTGAGPDLQVEMKSSVGETTEEKEVITYTITVKNNGKTAANNVTVSGTVPENTIYTYIDPDGMEGEIVRLYDNEVKSYSEKIASIAVGETKEIKYEVETKELKTNMPEEITAAANVTVEGFEDNFASNEVKTKLVRGSLKINLGLVQIPEAFPRQVGDEVIYQIDIQNVNSVAKFDVTITQELSDGIKFRSASQNGTYDETTNKVTWNISKIGENGRMTLYVTVNVKELPENTYQKTISSKVTAKGEGFEVESNKLDFNVKKGILKVTLSSSTKQEVTEGSTIVYNAIIENIGAGIVSGIKITNIIPEGLKFEKAQYSRAGKVIPTREVTSIAGLDGGEKLEFTIYLKAEDLENGKDSLEVKNVIKVEQDGQDDIYSNEITHKIVKRASSGKDDSVDPGEIKEGTHSITGMVWEDLNNNGKRDEGELGIDGVTVMLVNSENGKIVKDITTGRNKEQKTISGGEYAFNNLEAGNYMVVFLYDTEKYGITTYKKEGVNDDKNSDAVSLEVQVSGNKQMAGVSDKLNLSNSDINNIDMGLIENPKFDLKLDKVISKITMQANGKTTEYKYEDSKFAKLDLNQKTIKDTSLIIEYKIRVTNEGKVAGYASKIIDYLPDGMKFSSELNPEWYQSSNGNVYNASLANTLINPGETKEVTLLLTKKMTENNLGLINNTAEIYECYNDLGLKDVDSTAGNKVQKEDDISSADAMIGVKTGEVYVYITITLISIGILAVGIYYIKKKVLAKI